MSLDCLSHASSADGLTTDYYDKIDDKYMDACYVASYILQTNVFSFLGSKVHVKSSLSGKIGIPSKTCQRHAAGHRLLDYWYNNYSY